jgi:MFS family permease
VIATLWQRLHFARAFRSRPYAMLWAGQAISSLGNSVFSIALAWQVLLMTHSGTAIGIVLLTMSIPQLVFVLIGGVAADRLPRRTIILWSDGGRGLVVLLITILGFTGHLQFWHLVVEALIFGTVSGFFDPAIMSIIPDLVEKDDLASANALKSLSGNLARLLGPMLGALLIALISPMGAFAANALSFFLSVAFLLAVRIPERHVAPPQEASGAMVQAEEAPAKRKGFRGVVVDMWEGLGYVRGSRWLLTGILASSVGNIGLIPPLYVALPLLVNKVYGQGAWLLGLISAADAIGSIVALLLIGQAAKIKRRGLLAYLSLFPTCLGLIILGLPFPHVAAPVIAPLAGAMVGFGLAFFNTIWFTIMQEMIPREKLGRVLSLDSLGNLVMAPAAQGIGGILTDSIGPAMVCILGGSLCLVTMVIPLFVREIREME